MAVASARCIPEVYEVSRGRTSGSENRVTLLCAVVECLDQLSLTHGLFGYMVVDFVSELALPIFLRCCDITEVF